MTSGRSDLVDIAAEIRVDRPLALLLYDGATTAWVPKSQVEANGDGTFTMSESLAIEKGFL